MVKAVECRGMYTFRRSNEISGKEYSSVSYHPMIENGNHYVTKLKIH